MYKNIKFFLGANSDKGFVSYFEQLQDFKESLQLFILKGGPGSGKSSLMKKICEYARSRGNFIEHIHCASDPSSLDGFIDHTACFAMVDGTSPHVVDPRLPGVTGRIINCGEFWDEGVLQRNKRDINKLTQQISDCHSSATAYIKAASSLIRENMRLAKPAIREKEARSFSKMITDMLPLGNSPKESIRLLSAATIGKVEFFSDTLSAYCKKIYVLDDPWGSSADLLLNEIRRYAHSNGTEIILCPCSIIPDRIEHIIIPSEGISISVKNSFHGAQEAFATAGGLYSSLVWESEMKRRALMAQRLINHATSAIEKAKNLHDDLESYYVEAMDFSGLESIADRVKSRIVQ